MMKRRPAAFSQCFASSLFLLVAVILLFAAPTSSARRGAALAHTSNWAVLIDVSRYWFNYRHASNTLSMYRTVKRLGIPDERIILMLADDTACNPRNPYPSEVHNNRRKDLNLYGDNVEVDYRGYEVTVDNIMRVLTGRHSPAVPRSKRLLSDSRSNVLVYITGHGGDEFMKVQDHKEIAAQDLADSFAQMKQKGRFNELFLVVETCQASTMYKRIDSEGIFMCASSGKTENSYSHHSDGDIGVSVIDRFTFYTLQFFERVTIDSQASMAELYRTYDNVALGSTFKHDEHLISRRLEDIKVTEMFGYVAAIDLTRNATTRGAEAAWSLVAVKVRELEAHQAAHRDPGIASGNSPGPRWADLAQAKLASQQQLQQDNVRTASADGMSALGHRGRAGLRVATGVRLGQCQNFGMCDGQGTGVDGCDWVTASWDPILLGCVAVIAVITMVADMMVMLTIT